MKLFVVSDPHSYFTVMYNALKEKGFEENNPSHLLVVCGDVFDRGGESMDMLKYLDSLENVVLIRGNHEDLMDKLLYRQKATNVDASNGTLRTFNDILYNNVARYDKDANWFSIVRDVIDPFFFKFVDYFETKNYVFVHGWIPMKYDTTKKFAEYGDPTLFDENWRDGDWDSARWFNGIKCARRGIKVPGKTVVCGHWHCSYGWSVESAGTEEWVTEFGSDAIWEPYRADGVIAIDRCTAHTNEVNVLVLEDELL